MRISCDRIDKNIAAPKLNDYQRFKKLDRERKQILNDWFELVWKMREHPVNEHFLAFQLTYSLLDQIAVVISSRGSDEERFAALFHNPEMGKIFDGMMDEPKSLMRMYSKRFAALWPIFDTSIDMNPPAKWKPSVKGTPRDETVKKYLSSGYNHQPGCWLSHVEFDQKILPDWKHSLAVWHTLYRNLQTGAWNNTESEIRIYSNGFLSLLYFYKEGKIFFENPSLKPDIFERTQVLSSL